MAKNCTVWLLSDKTINDTTFKFPVVDYSNVYYNNAHSLQDTIDYFLTYNHNIEGTDTFTNISSIDFSRCYFKVETSFKNANTYNYCVIHDNNENKYYCCFVKSITWDSNLVVATFNFEIDIFHTYIKQVKFKKCFVEREHVDDDTFGLHVLDEGIGVSEYVAKDFSDFNTINYIPVVAISDTSLIGHYVNGTFTKDVDVIVNVNQYEKTICLVAPNNNSSLGLKGMESFTQFIDMMYFQNKGNSIVCCFYMPSEFLSTHFVERGWQTFPEQGDTSPLGALYVSKNVTSSVSPSSVSISKPSRTINYGGKSININNNKSLIFPFCFGEITNNNGGKLQLKFELSNNSNNVISCAYYNSMVHGGKPYLYATNYDGLTTNLTKSLTGLENADLPYIHNSYGAYISSQRNALTNSIEYIKSDKDLAIFNNNIDTVQKETGQLINMVSDATSLNVGGYINSLMDMGNTEIDAAQTENNIRYNSTKAIDSVNASLRDAKTKGNTSSGVACCNSLFNIGKHGFTKCVYVPQYEEMKTIDNYFSKFGYKVNDYKVPELKSRRIFNYVKCSEVNLTANIPTNHINIMKAIFAQGVTLWHDLEMMYTYDFDNNTIVS